MPELVYDAKGNVIAMSQIYENLPLPPISADIPKGRLTRCTNACKNLQVWLKDSKLERDYSGSESEQGSNEKGNHPAKEWLPSEDKRDDEELIANPGLWGLGFEVMLIQHCHPRRVWRRQAAEKTEIWHMTRVDVYHLTCGTVPYSAHHYKDKWPASHVW